MQTKSTRAKKTSLQLFEENGLLGCMEAASDLSSNYKEQISKVIRKKSLPNKAVKAKRGKNSVKLS